MVTIKQLKKKIKGVFVQPIKKYYLGKIAYGTPYFYPINFNSTILAIRKLELKPKEAYDEYVKNYPHLKNSSQAKFRNIPMGRRSKDKIIKIFDNYYFIEIGYPISINKINLGWKDKWETPRFEYVPSFQIYFFKWQFCIFWKAPDGDDDKYYEMILWYLYYSDKDLRKAEETYPWIDYVTKKSVWNNKYIIKKENMLEVNKCSNKECIMKLKCGRVRDIKDTPSSYFIPENNNRYKFECKQFIKYGE